MGEVRDVRMPDGTIIKGVPVERAGTLLQLYQQAATQLAGEDMLAGLQRGEFPGQKGNSANLSAKEVAHIFAGYLLSATPKQLEGVFQQALPDAKIRHDSKGDAIVEYQGKEFYINKPGASPNDVISLSGLILAGGRVARAISEIPSAIGRVIAGFTGGTATSAGMDLGAGALGAEGGIDIPRAVAAGASTAALAPIARMTTTAPLTTQQARAGAQASYQAAERAGLVIDPTRIPVANWEAAATRAGLDIPAAFARNPSNTPQAMRLFERIGEEVAAGPLTLERMETLRRIAVGIREAGRNEGGQLTNDGAVAAALIRNMDQFVNGLTAADLVAGANANAATAALREARRLWNVQAKSHTIEILRDRADLAAPTKGWDQALRESFRPLARDPAEMSRFTAEEQRAIRSIVRGGTIDAALRLLGRVGPEGGAALGGAAGLALGGTAGVVEGGVRGGAAATVTREVARGLSGRISHARSDELNNMILGGQVIPAPFVPIAGMETPRGRE